MISSFTQPAAALILITAVTGCTVFPDRDPPRVMDIPVSDATPTESPAFGKTIRIDTPQATEPFDSSRILNKPTANEFQMYGKVRWRDTAPVLVRELMIGTLRADGRFEGVINETSPSASDLTLTSDLYGFHSETRNGQTTVKVTLYGQVMDNRSRKTLCTENIQVNIAAPGSGIDDVIPTFGEAGNELSRQMRDWLGRCLD